MADKKTNASETVTVRLPEGMAKQISAATGQKFSTLVRAMCTNLLDRLAAEGKVEKGQQS